MERYVFSPPQHTVNHATGTGIGTSANQVPLGAALFAITGSPKSESIVLYHILRGIWQPNDLLAAGSVNSLLGELLNQSLPLNFSPAPNDTSTVVVQGLYGNPGPLSSPPLKACNGLLYTTTAMLAPAANMSVVPEISTEVDAVDIRNAPQLLSEGFNFSSRTPSNWTSASILEAFGMCTTKGGSYPCTQASLGIAHHVVRHSKRPYHDRYLPPVSRQPSRPRPCSRPRPD